MQAGHRADIDVMRGQLSRAEARLSQNEAKLNQTEAKLNQKLDRAEAKADQNELQLNQTKAKLNQTEAKLDESKVARRSLPRVLTRVALNHLWCAGPGSDAHRRAQAKARAELEQARAEARAELGWTKARLDGALRQLDEVGARVEVREADPRRPRHSCGPSFRAGAIISMS
jgi:DNA repair exonuclease SbcCD ATPase subunit